LRTLNRPRPDREHSRDHDRPRLSERPRDRDRDQASRPRSDPAMPSSSSTRVDTGAGPQPSVSLRRRCETKFTSVKEAIRGIPEEVSEVRKKAGDCPSRGWKNDAPGAHQAINCVRPADMGTEAPSGSRPQHRVAAVRRSAKPDFNDDELEDERETKLSKVEIAALDAEEMPLYEEYESGDNFSE
jgi:hypothetical protein